MFDTEQQINEVQIPETAETIGHMCKFTESLQRNQSSDPEINTDGSISQSIMSEILYGSKRTNQVDQKIYYISILFVLFL